MRGALCALFSAPTSSLLPGQEPHTPLNTSAVPMAIGSVKELIEQPDAEQNRRQRSDHSHLRCERGADFSIASITSSTGTNGAQRRIENAEPDDFRRDGHRTRRAQNEKLPMHNTHAMLVARPERRNAPSRFTAVPLKTRYSA